MKPIEASPENSLDQQPALLVWSSWICGTGMGFLYSMASHCCFQQTVHHYSVWQESKHCAFKGQEKHIPLSLSSPFILHPYVALFSFTFSHFPLYILAISLPLFSSVQSPAAFKRRGTFNTCSCNNASLSAPGMETGFLFPWAHRFS